MRRTRRPPRPGWPTPGWDALLPLHAILDALCRLPTTPAAVVVLVPGAALLALAACGCVPQVRAVCSRRSVVPGVVLALLFGGWELSATVWGNDSAHPTFSLLLAPALETYPGRFVGWLAWLGVVDGW
ncbi:MAG: hypothetical protein WAN20_21220 [Pseudonocardiaceae bacterium]